MHDDRNRVVAYIRVSTTEQEKQGYSLDEQRRLAEERAVAEGWELVEVYEDVMSGRRNDRPAYRRLLDDAASGAFGAVIVWRKDRFGRDLIERLTTEAALRTAGVRLVSLTEGEIDQDDASAPLLEAISAGVAAMESRLIGQRVRGGLAKRAATGLYHGSRCPYGYRFEGERKERRLVLDHARAEIVRRIYASYLAGMGDGQIAYGLNEEAVPSPTGKLWCKSQIANLLRSPIYVGRVRYNDEVTKGQHDPIVVEQTWNETQVLRQARRQDHDGGAGRNPSGRHLLTRGLLRCGVCGGAMSPRTHHDRRGADGGPREVYRCLTRNGFRGSERCSMGEVERAAIDEVILEHFEHVSLDLEATRAQLTSAHDRRIAEMRERSLDAEREVMFATERFARVRRDYQDGRLDAEDWRDQRRDLDDELEAAQAQLARLGQQQTDAEHAAALLDAEAELVDQLARLRNAVAGRIDGAQGIDALRAALTSVFSRIDLVAHDDGELDLVPYVRTDPNWTPTEDEARTLRKAASGGLIDGYLPGNNRRAALQLTTANTGQTTSALSAGTNALLRLGATPLTRVEDVLETFGLERTVAPPRALVGSIAEQVLERLADAPAGIDELTRATGLGVAELAGALTELELAGLAVGSDGIYRAAPR